MNHEEIFLARVKASRYEQLCTLIERLCAAAVILTTYFYFH